MMVFRDATAVSTPLGLTAVVGLRVFIEVTALLKAFSTVHDGPNTVLNALSVLEASGLELSDDYSMSDVFGAIADVIIAIDGLYAEMPPIFNTKDESKAPPPVEEPWDYNDRVNISVWLHRIAYAYHWSREDILALDPVEAARLIQEIELDQIHHREFLHSLSEMAYTPDKSTKKMKYMPLKRPRWMIRRTITMPKPEKLPKKFMPVGLVIDAKSIMEEMEAKRKAAGT